jgi:hypothetical protein
MPTVNLKAVQFLAIALTALALVPGGAHLFALPNKIGMSQDAYFTAQTIYRGWALFALVIIPAALLNALLAFILRHRRWPSRLALAGCLGILATLAVFFVWTEPTNRATNYWTAAPANWDELRTQWEYSHAVNAAIMFAALCSSVLSALTTRD